MLSKAKTLADTRALLETESVEEQLRKIADFECELESMSEKFSELTPEQKKRRWNIF
jgi:hypothetical protein